MAKKVISGLFSLFEISDEQAMWRVQTQDDEEAFAILVRRWQEPIRQLCTRMTGDSHKGEDLGQEAFVRLFAKRKTYQPRSKFSTYLWRIAMNLCYDELRRVQRRRESAFPGLTEDEDFAERHATNDAGPDVRVWQTEEGALVKSALLRLPEIYRSVLVLRHYEGLKLREIAEVLEIPEGTVNSRMAEGLSQLTRLLEPQMADKPAVRRAPPREVLVL